MRYMSVLLPLVALLSSCGGGGETGPTIPPTPPAVANVVISGPTEHVVGRAASLSAEARDAQGAALANRTITWSSSDPSIVSIEGSAGAVVEIRAAGIGRAEIRATSEGKVATMSVTVRAPQVTAVAVSPSTISLLVGDQARLVSTVSREPEASGAVVWTSSDARVASVDLSGQVSALAAGVAVITATSTHDPNRKGAATVTVTARPAPQVTHITLSPTRTEFFVREIAEVRVATSGELNANPAVTWRTSNPAVATVTGLGISLAHVAGVGEGTATITATSVATPSVSASIVVTVRTPRVTDIRLSSANVAVFVGRTSEITVTIIGDPGSAVLGLGTVTSSDPSIATVSQQEGRLAIVRGVAVGTARLTFPTTNPNVAATAVVTVLPTPQVRSITIDEPRVTIQVGEVRRVFFRISADSGTFLLPPSYRSSDTTVVTAGYTTASNAIVLTGRSPGTATVFVETGNPAVVGTVEVTVLASNVRAISVDSASVTVRLPASGGTNVVTVGYQITGDPMASRAVVIASSNPDVATATVGNGMVTITGKAPGAATITLTSEATPSVSARISVTVVRSP